jgi:uncharacterized membrane protein
MSLQLADSEASLRCSNFHFKAFVNTHSHQISLHVNPLLTMAPLSIFHIISGAGCLALSAFVLFNFKGTRLHRVVGTAYVLAMLVLNVTALCIYHLTGRFNLFHLFAILSLAMVAVGYAQVIYRRRLQHWFYRHYTYMCWFYAGLLAATSNEAFVRVHVLITIVQARGNWVILEAQGVILGLCAILLSINKARLHNKYAFFKNLQNPLTRTSEDGAVHSS